MTQSMIRNSCDTILMVWQGDIIGCLLDRDSGEISFSQNGSPLGLAFRLDPRLKAQPLFPTVCMKNAELELNFGGQPFSHKPEKATGIGLAPKDWVASGKH